MVKRKVSLENWENNWDNVQPFFKYGPQTRKSCIQQMQ